MLTFNLSLNISVLLMCLSHRGLFLERVMGDEVEPIYVFLGISSIVMAVLCIVAAFLVYRMIKGDIEDRW